MFLRAKQRLKDGKVHRYWSIVENRRVAGNRVVQRQVLYLGEINDSQQAAWCKTIEVLQAEHPQPVQVALFPDDREAPPLDCAVIQVQVNGLRVCHPRQWGACWLACTRWDQLELDRFWADKLKPSRKGTRWLNVLKTLVVYRLLEPGSEWRLYRHWYERSALGDLLGEDFSLVQIQKLYRCLDRVLPYKAPLFSFLKQRWQLLFEVGFDVLLYDLTSTYFEAEPPDSEKKKYGYSRDKRPDCVQVVIALVVTPEGFPLAYEVLAGNTSDKTTLEDFVKKIEEQYGRRRRVWVMDRGIPTEEALAAMRACDPPVQYLVGTPKGHLNTLETRFLSQSWKPVREQVEVKLLAESEEVYILTRSQGRLQKERAIRRRRLKKLWKRLHELSHQRINRDQLLLKLGAAKKEAGRTYSLIDFQLPTADQPVNSETFCFSLNKKKLRQVRRREGHYLLRSNLNSEDPATLWQYYIQLTEVEQAFKELKTDLAIRPIYHQLDQRIEAHIFVAFLAYCLQVTLKNRARALASGLSPRAVLDKFAALQMVDVHLPTTDGRHLILSRYTEPETDQKLLLQQLGLHLPPQLPPRVTEKSRLSSA